MQRPGRYNTVKFGKDAVDSIMEGVREVTEATATSLGPLGKNSIIDREYDFVIVHDGVTIADSIQPKEPFKRAGSKIVQEAAKKQRDSVGDGTTVAMVLTQAILDETLKATASGINPMTLRRGLESGAKKVTDKIKSLATPVKTLKQKIQIATISAEDEELGKLVAETIHKIGDEGVLTVEESKAAETYVEHQEGMQVDKGYAHAFMMTDPERQTAVLEDAYILITDIPLNSIADIGKFLEHTIFPNTKKVLFISPEIGLDFMQVLLNSKMQGTFLGVAMRAPGVAHHQTEILQDLCALTGATLITKEAGMKFDDQPFSALGQAHRIVMSKISTIITGGRGRKDDILQRIAVIKKQMEDTDISDFDREQLKARLGKLTNGVAVIKVAGQTEVEMKERKERALDAVASTQSAVKHGYVPGGEIIYLGVLDILDENVLGEKILKNALKAPFKRLVENAGYDSGELLAIRSQTKGPEFDINKVGYDVVDGEFKDMVKTGIIDSVAVPTTAVKTAVSVAVQLSSLGAAVVLENEEKNK